MQSETLSGAQLVGGVLLLVLGPGGATFIGLRVGLNGLRRKIDDTYDRVEKIDTKLDSVTTMVHEDRAEIGRIEERVESHAGWIRRVEEEVKEDRRRHPR